MKLIKQGNGLILWNIKFDGDVLEFILMLLYYTEVYTDTLIYIDACLPYFAEVYI